MYDFLFYILQAAEIVMFMRGIVRLELHKSRMRLSWGIITLLLGAVIYAFCPDRNISMIVGMILLQMIGTILLFDVPPVSGIAKYWFSSSYVVILHMPSNLILILINEMTKSNISYEVRQIISTFISMALIIVISRFIGRHRNAVTWIRDIPTVYFFLAFLCGTSTTGITACIRVIETKVNGSVRILLYVLNFVVCVCLYAVGIGFAVADLWRKQYKRDSELKDECIRKTKEYYQSLKEHIREIRSMKHDMNAHLDILSRLAEKGEWDKLKDYLKEIREESLGNNLMIVNTGNSIVSAVLTDAMRKSAAREGISLICEGSLPDKLLISDYDLCTMFSNLIANSIEACLKLENKKREIYIEFYIVNSSLTIICKNPIEWELDVSLLNNGYTSKDDKARHGYGVENIRRTVRSYDADIKMYVKDETFITKIVFYNAMA